MDNIIELVTSPNKDLKSCLKELEDIVYFCLKNTDDDFWPASIPMSIEDESGIPIADYGSSNSGRLKKLYRGPGALIEHDTRLMTKKHSLCVGNNSVQ